MGGRVLEREHELSVLAAAAHDAGRGSGSAVLVSGEAGIGKSVLVDALRPQLPAEGRLLVGYCDDLTTRRTLGPLRDLLGNVGAELAQALQEGTERERVLAALRQELDWPGRPTVLVVEDVHWADEATLDVLRFLVRRVGELPAVLVLTYRDDEVGRDHPLQALLGLASGLTWVRRVPLQPLSIESVRSMCQGTSFDPDQMFALTAGNPFFVSETLAAGRQDQVPSTIVDAVLARVRLLDPTTRDALEQLAVVTSALDRHLVDRLVPEGWDTLATAEQRGLLTVRPSRVAFRHEVTRRAIVDSVPAARRIELNRRVLAVLAGLDDADLSELVHHATAAGDAAAIVRYAPAAAREAARAGAHREAVAHFALSLEHGERFAPDERAELFEGFALECYTIGAADHAVSAQREAVALRRELGDPRLLGASLRWLSRFHWWNGERVPAESAAVEAIAVLEATQDTRLLALALSNRSQLHMLAEEHARSIELGLRAAELAREAGDAETLAHALNNVGTSRWLAGDRSGQAVLEESLRIALDTGATDHALRAYIALSSCLLDEYRLDEAEAYLDAGISLAEASDHVGFRAYLVLERSRLEFSRGEWDAAESTVAFAMQERPPLRWVALVTEGRIRARRGEQGADELLQEAWRLALEMDELQRTGPAAVGLAEAAWLAGHPESALPAIQHVYEEARRLDKPSWIAEFSYWMGRAGKPVSPGSGDYPYALQAAGRWRETAAAWEAAGCPYERAAALAESAEPEYLLVALRLLQDLGAEPLSRIVAARLREAGVAHVPRGPSAASRRNPAGLTARQMEVVDLLAQGLTNAAIAERLVLSVRTVDSHVAAILAKLGAADRADAVRRARERGVLGTPG